METLKIFNKNDKPFGDLSNNAYFPITIDTQIYPSVTNYVLSKTSK